MFPPAAVLRSGAIQSGRVARDWNYSLRVDDHLDDDQGNREPGRCHDCASHNNLHFHTFQWQGLSIIPVINSWISRPNDKVN